MKNLIVVLAVVSLFFASDSHTQFLTGFGIKAGVTIANTNILEPDNTPFYETKNILGFNGSLFAEMLNNKIFNLVVDAGYEQRGYAFEVIKTDEFGNEIGRYDVKNRTHYITAGLLGKVKYKTKTVSPYIIVGPRADFYLGYSISTTDDENWSETNSLLEQFKKINYSINLGAGLEFEKLLPFKTLVEFNYSPPINTSFNNGYLEVKEHYFNIKLGINFIKDKRTKK